MKIHLPIFFVFFFIIVFNVHAATFYINDGVTSDDFYCSAAATSGVGIGGAGTLADPWHIEDLNAIIASAFIADGDDIILDGMTYNCSSVTIFINKRVTIRGRHSADLPTSNALRSTEETVLGGIVTFSIARENVEISGIYFNNLLTGGPSFDKPIKMTSAYNGIAIKNNVFNGHASATSIAIEINVIGAPTCSHLIEGNYITDYANGIDVRNISCGTSTISNNRIIDLKDVGGSNFAIGADRAENMSIINNIIKAANKIDRGILLTNTTGGSGTLRNNLIHRNVIGGPTLGESNIVHGIQIGLLTPALETNGLNTITENDIMVSAIGGSRAITIRNGDYPDGHIKINFNKLRGSECDLFIEDITPVSGSASTNAELNSWSSHPSGPSIGLGGDVRAGLAGLIAILTSPSMGVRCGVWLTSDTDNAPGTPGFQPLNEAEFDETNMGVPIQNAFDIMPNTWQLNIDPHADLNSDALIMLSTGTKALRSKATVAPFPLLGSLGVNNAAAQLIIRDYPIEVQNNLRLLAGELKNASGHPQVRPGGLVERTAGYLTDPLTTPHDGVDYLYTNTTPLMNTFEIPDGLLRNIRHLELGGGADVTLSTSVRMEGLLSFSPAPSKLILGTYSILLTPTASINGSKPPSIDSYVITNGGGYFRKAVIPALGNFSFPIGTTSSYAPFAFFNTSLTASISNQAKAIDITLYDDPEAVSGSPVSDRTKMCWEAQTDATSYDVQMNWQPADVIGTWQLPEMRIARREAGTDFPILPALTGTITASQAATSGAALLRTDLLRYIVYERVRIDNLTTTLGSPNCAGASTGFSYDVHGNYSVGTIFQIQMSDAAGSFASPTIIDSETLATAISGDVSRTRSPVIIPTSTAQGTGYKFRVVCSPVPSKTSNEIGPYTISHCININGGGIAPLATCAGGNVDVTFTAFGTFNAGNIFSVELSDASGSFASPTLLSPTLVGTAPGAYTITGVTIPGITPNGTGYRLRMRSSNPVSIIPGSSSADALTVNGCIQTQPIVPALICAGGYISVPFQASGSYIGGEFRVQISSDGFASFTDVTVTPFGTGFSYSGTTTGSVPVFIPLAASGAMAVRVYYTTPATLGTSTPLTINPKPNITSVSGSSPASCFVGTGTLTITLSAATTAPYSLDWNYDGIADRTGLLGPTILNATSVPTGLYDKFIITDSNGCKDTLVIGSPISIIEPKPVILAATLNQPFFCEDTTANLVVKIATPASGSLYAIDFEDNGSYDMTALLLGENLYYGVGPSRRIGRYIRIRNIFDPSCPSSVYDLGDTMRCKPKIVPRKNLEVDAVEKVVMYGEKTDIKVWRGQAGVYYRLKNHVTGAFIGTAQLSVGNDTLVFSTDSLKASTVFSIGAMHATTWCTATLTDTQTVRVVTRIDESDSLALVALYDSTCGSTWSSPWDLYQPIKTWAGVYTARGRVVALDLFNRGLCNRVPKPVYLMPRLNRVNVASNALDYASLEPFQTKGLVEFKYNPQENVNLEYDTARDEGKDIDFEVNIGGSSNVYSWYKNDSLLTIPSATSKRLSLINLKPSDSGTYVCRVTNAIVPDIVIERRKIHLEVISAPYKADSIAVLAIHESLKTSETPSPWGADIRTPLREWSGISMAGSRVRGIDWPSKNLDGTLPSVFGGAEGALVMLEYFNLFSNQLKEELPATLFVLDKLKYLDLSYNQLKGDVSGAIGNMKNLEVLWLAGNQFSELPNSIGDLVKLQVLDVSDNPIKVLPTTIANLSALRSFYANNIQISSLPSAFSNLTNLQDFYLNNNALKILPLDFSKFSKLRRFSARNNQLSALPTSLAIRTLEHLDISSNALDFADLTPLKGKAISFVYAPQADLDVAIDSIVRLGTTITLSVSAAGSGNTYTWLKGGLPITTHYGYNTTEMIMTDFREEYAGVYVAEVRNAKFPDLVLLRKPVVLQPGCRIADNVVLVALTPNLVCDNEPLNVLLNIKNAAGFRLQWFRNGEKLFSATNDSLSVAKAGIYFVEMRDDKGCLAYTNELEVRVVLAPNVSISQDGFTLRADSTSSDWTYQWFLDGKAIEGAKTAIYTPTKNGTYTLRVINRLGCDDLSNTLPFGVTGFADNTLSKATTLYPNPTAEEIFILLPQNAILDKDATISVIDALGKQFSIEIWARDKHYLHLNVMMLPSGSYFLKIPTSGGLVIKQFVVRR